MNNYTYDEIQRERLTILLEGIIRELAWQDNLVIYTGKNFKIKCDHNETSDFFIDRLSGMDDESFKELKKKLLELICNI